jgi:hypothetical protein
MVGEKVQDEFGAIHRELWRRLTQYLYELCIESGNIAKALEKDDYSELWQCFENRLMRRE